MTQDQETTQDHTPLLSPVIWEQEREEARILLARAFRAARNYDGSALKFDRLIFHLAAVEHFADQRRSGTSLERDEIEAALTIQVRRQGHTPITVADLLELAIKSFGKRLNNGRIDLQIIKTGFSFLPTLGINPISVGENTEFDLARFEPRFNRIIILLNQNDITTDDLRIYRGIALPNAMRVEPYTLIQIPRLNREIAVSDQVNNAIFIGMGQRGPLFWAIHNKDHILMQEGVARVVCIAGWEDRLLSMLLEDNLPGPRIAIGGESSFPLTEDLIIVKALEYSAVCDWQLPTQNSGAVIGLSGETWKKWHKAIRRNYRGLKRHGVKGLTHLLQLYGLKTGRLENPETIQKSWQSYQRTGRHGLNVTEDDASTLSEDLIIVKALEYAVVHDWKLPSAHNGGEVPGLPGQTWMVWDQAIRKKYRGLKREGMTGLPHLFRLYGLKISQTSNSETAQQAWRHYQETGEHGLSPIEDNTGRLTEEFIITKAIEYAAANNWRLPTADSGKISGLPSQTWSSWHSSIMNRHRGLERQGMKGLSHLFRLYGLKIERVENLEVIKQAWQNHQETGHHGLHPIEDDASQLTEDLIIVKALEYAAAHNWHLPAGGKYGVPGLSGQTWSIWNTAISKRSRGLKRQGMTGLSHLFRLYGLKMGRSDNPEMIRTAWQNYKGTGQHGLKID